jgi:CheY-like chemotaxis protein
MRHNVKSGGKRALIVDYDRLTARMLHEDLNKEIEGLSVGIAESTKEAKSLLAMTWDVILVDASFRMGYEGHRLIEYRRALERKGLQPSTIIAISNKPKYNHQMLDSGADWAVQEKTCCEVTPAVADVLSIMEKGNIHEWKTKSTEEIKFKSDPRG